jgi:hypothetical protein
LSEIEAAAVRYGRNAEASSTTRVRRAADEVPAVVASEWYVHIGRRAYQATGVAKVPHFGAAKRLDDLWTSAIRGAPIKESVRRAIAHHVGPVNPPHGSFGARLVAQ